MAETKKTKKENPFPTEMIDLPSGGKLYQSSSPLSSGQIEIKYMTAREEDILTSQNLIKKGVVIDKLINALIISDGISVDDLFLGDKNAVMVAARILAYGPEYTVELTNPSSGEKFDYTFDLSELSYKSLPSDINYSENKFDIKLPNSESEIVFKLLNGRDETLIEQELKSLSKLSSINTREVTTRLKHTIVSVDGKEDQKLISNFVDNMLSRDSLFLRNKIADYTPDIVLEQEVDMDGDTVTVDIPMTVNFFWPTS